MTQEYRYTYELRGDKYFIYDRGTKIAEVSSYGREAKEIAKNITYSLNMRNRWLSKNKH